MRAGYKLRPVTIVRPAGRRPTSILVAIALLGSLAVLKPWTLIDTSVPEVSSLPAATPVPVATSAVAAPRVAAPPGLGSLASHSGTWGVGVAGIGPRYDGESWADWTAVTPVEVSPSSGATAGAMPAIAGCTGVPSLLAGPLFVAVSHAVDVPIERHVFGWSWNGPTATALVGSIHQVTPPGDRGFAFVIRDDRAPWPAGRYEFHLVAGDRAVALTVCLKTAT
jgi:hypothetical protein